jgi:hypothetical protein
MLPSQHIFGPRNVSCARAAHAFVFLQRCPELQIFVFEHLILNLKFLDPRQRLHSVHQPQHDATIIAAGYYPVVPWSKCHAADRRIMSDDVQGLLMCAVLRPREHSGGIQPSGEHEASVDAAADARQPSAMRLQGSVGSTR